MAEQVEVRSGSKERGRVDGVVGIGLAGGVDGGWGGGAVDGDAGWVVAG